MMLDDPTKFAPFDSQDMLGHIDALTTQFENAWHHAQTQPLPEDFKKVKLIVIAGMGGSAIGADYFAALVEGTCPAPILVNRHYDLPAYVQGPDTLFIASSHSGNTEETLASFAEARKRGVKLMVITTGGKLEALAPEAGATLWKFSYQSQPRAAFGWSFGLLAGLAHRLGYVDLTEDVKETLAVMRKGYEEFKAATPTVQNAAKRYAGQFAGRIGVFYGSGIMAPVARRWKGQLNENAKHWAEWDVMPEQNHNGIVGTEFPEKGIAGIFSVFLKSSYDHYRVTVRQELTTKEFLAAGVGVDSFTAKGKSRLAQMMNATQFGDYLSYYVAMLNGADPTPIPPIIALKEGLAKVK